ncbi:MAG: alanine/glycine:cation symporter family protein [Verrucomicrobiota bacterium JB022]|nr:alanine/glycine:cation symporter family protein [Verrucomicrobiota bacterium JB022]
MAELVNWLNGIIWSPALIFLALGTGLYFSFATRFLQLRHVKDMFSYLFGGDKSHQGLTSFQAFALAVSGRVGTGNIAGVATAIAMGGPGALFWMWVIAFVGAGSGFVEATLAQIYKREVDGEFRGGPSYYIEKGLGIKWFAALFAVAMLIATGLCLPGIQANSIVVATEEAFGIPRLTMGAVIVVLLSLIIFGGVKRIGRTAQYVVPIMAIGYILVALVVVGINITKVPEVFMLVVRSAFGADAAFGGILGAAISMGVKRGIYSNEAGQGTAPMAAATAVVDHPAKQGLVQAFSVYFDTWLVCSATGFMILVSGLYNVSNGADGFIIENLPGTPDGPIYTQMAVDSVLPGFGSAFVAVALFFFAFTTLMAYYYYAETNVAYLIKSPVTRWRSILAVRVIFLGITLYCSVNTADLAWALGDVGVGLTAWLNFIAILLLQKPALECLRDYERQQKQGLDPVYRPLEMGHDNANYWIARNEEAEAEPERVAVGER